MNMQIDAYYNQLQVFKLGCSTLGLAITKKKKKEKEKFNSIQL